jgi:hypothetical protein
VDQYASNPQAFYSKENILFLPGARYPEPDIKLARPLFAIAINTKLQRKERKPVKLAQITHPARTVLFLEQGLPKERRRRRNNLITMAARTAARNRSWLGMAVLAL